MSAICFVILASHGLATDVLRFDGGYVEIWFRVTPGVRHDEQPVPYSESALDSYYSYDLEIVSDDGSDSASIRDTKDAFLSGDAAIVDYVPLTLYPGRFGYTMRVYIGHDTCAVRGSIDMPLVTEPLSCSDVVLGRIGASGQLFHGVCFLPAVTAEFYGGEGMLSYIEIYGVEPDSLQYEAVYRISDSRGEVLLEQRKKVLKYDYVQVDTHAISLRGLTDGTYDYSIAIKDPSSGTSVIRDRRFSVTIHGDIVEPRFYREIQYFVSTTEYKRFEKLNEEERRVYLKEFWSRRDYYRFERRVLESDAAFSTYAVQGRDSERGRLYIKQGPPDEVEVVPIADWARPFEVWCYYGRQDYVFCDTRDDHNPRLIRVLKPGELTKLLETGIRDGTLDEDWLSDVAPGTYGWDEEVELIVE